MTCCRPVKEEGAFIREVPTVMANAPDINL